MKYYNSNEIYFLMTSTNQEASLTEKITFFTASSIAGGFLIRNFLRIRSYTRSFRQMQDLISADFSGVMNILEGKSGKGLVLLQSITPNFPLNYFENIEDRKQYTVRLGKFYQGLNFPKGFEGVLKHKGRDFHLEFKMNRPTVGSDLAQTTREFDKRNMKLYKYQMVAVYGELSFNRQSKRGQMETKMLCLDWLEFEKYWKMKLIATILSSFYMGIILGVAICIWAQRQIHQIDILKGELKAGAEQVAIRTRELWSQLNQLKQEKTAEDDCAKIEESRGKQQKKG